MISNTSKLADTTRQLMYTFCRDFNASPYLNLPAVKYFIDIHMENWVVLTTMQKLQKTIAFWTCWKVLIWVSKWSSVRIALKLLFYYYFVIIYLKLKGLARGGSGVSRPTPGEGCIPACTEADPPPLPRGRLLLWMVSILLECNLVLVIY